MERPRGDWQCIVGRKVTAVVVSSNEREGVRAKVQLVFSDDSNFEIYSVGGTLAGCERLYRGNIAEVLSHEHPGTDVWVFAEPPEGS